MLIDWDEINRVVSPLKDYEDLCERFQKSCSFSFVRETYNFSMSGLADYTLLLLGSDTRGRYGEYVSKLTAVISALEGAGVADILSLVARTGAREQLTKLVRQSGIIASELASLLKYLVYWVVPAEKYLSGLVGEDPESAAAIKVLRETGIRTNLELLQQGISAAGRKALAETSRLPEEVILELVNRADFSRLPWASKATISNIIGAGYASLAALASADPEQLYADFFAYGKAIGKNLKLGNEIENSYRIAKIIPKIIEA